MSTTPAERFSISPAPSWSFQPDINAVQDKNRETGAVNLFYQQQHHAEERGLHIRNIYRLENAEAVRSGSNIEFEFEPSRHRLDVHHVNVMRNGEEIPCAEIDEFRFIQPEADRHALVFDGRYVAIILLDDVRAGDIIDVSSTIYNIDPILPDAFYGNLLCCAPAGADHFRAELVTHPKSNLSLRVLGGEVEFIQIDEEPGRVRHIFEEKEKSARDFSPQAPSWYRQLPVVTWSSFESWRGVSSAIGRLWESHLGDETDLPELEACLTENRGSSDDLSSQIDSLIRFVQNDIRYLALSEGIGSHVPRPPFFCPQKALRRLQRQVDPPLTPPSEVGSGGLACPR